ncbi:DMT family transporter [Pontibaca methylaminivorans]|uniref:EamA-like transporter family protein n=1 Tax=Pontibaca methylaminivorans TaxID=515897 RepID=A0A1R3WJ63_9RHOB|nr:DMT family transporter [Pontibaca methylaminivorans]SIT76663.1 EamA-like transporter family protein [Pontibaca methylaminivorans]
MPVSVFAAVVFAAFLHAAWNALIKSGRSKTGGALTLVLLQGIFGAVLVMTRPWPETHVWYWLVGSGLFHTSYMLFLALAYEKGDLSRVYPIARGAAPMVVTLVSVLALVDRIAPLEYLGIIVLGLGVAVMAQGAFRNDENRRLVPLALGSAMMTAGYSLVDGLGARAAGDAVLYTSWLFVLNAVFFLPISLFMGGRELLPQDGREWLRGTVAAAASYGAYVIAIWAMTQAPIALVAALRESSILFALLIGWLVFRDRMDLPKVLAAVMILSGMVLMRF